MSPGDLERALQVDSEIDRAGAVDAGGEALALRHAGVSPGRSPVPADLHAAHAVPA